MRIDNGDDCLPGADALIVVTQWDEFRVPSFEDMKTALKEPVIIDGRNMFSPSFVEGLGFEYYGIGRGRSVAATRRVPRPALLPRVAPRGDFLPLRGGGLRRSGSGSCGRWGGWWSLRALHVHRGQ